MEGLLKLEFKLSNDELLRIRAQIVDALIPLTLKVNQMSEQIIALAAEVESLKSLIQTQTQSIAVLVSSSDAATANMEVLKQKLDAAVAGQGTLTQADVDALNAAMASLAEAKALVAGSTTEVARESQDLADATASTSPSN